MWGRGNEANQLTCCTFKISISKADAELSVAHEICSGLACPRRLSVLVPGGTSVGKGGAPTGAESSVPPVLAAGLCAGGQLWQ